MGTQSPIAGAVISVRALLEVSGLDRRLWERAKRMHHIPTVRVGKREYVSYDALRRWVGDTLARWLITTIRATARQSPR